MKPYMRLLVISINRTKMNNESAQRYTKNGVLFRHQGNYRQDVLPQSFACTRIRRDYRFLGIIFSRGGQISLSYYRREFQLRKRRAAFDVGARCQRQYR